MAFIQLTSPLILAGDPTLPNHAATKQYVDNKANNIDAAGFSSGLLNVMRLPALVGDVTMAAGSGTLVLPPTGVNPGTYTKVVLNTSGRVTTGGVLDADDMPNISWAKITSGRPTTLAGYGISNVIGMSGGTITGILSSSAVPSASLHLVTKSYVDSMIQPSGESLATGDIVRKGIVSTSPSGFLRANGSKVSKTTYSALYSILGDRYEVLYKSGIQTPYAQQESINLAGEPTGTTLNFNNNTTYPDYCYIRAAFATHNRLLAIGVAKLGGYRYMRTIHAPLNADGTAGTWVDDTNARFSDYYGVTDEYSYIGIFMHNNRVYFQTYYSDRHRLYRSNIKSDGTITNQLPIATPSGFKNITKVISVKNKHYFFDFDFAGTSGPLEFASGEINSSGDIINIVGLGQVNADLKKEYLIDVFVYKNKVFVFGMTGISGSNYLYTLYYASINSDGTLSSWVTASNTLSLPYYLKRTTTIVTTSGVFLVHNGPERYIQVGSGESSYFAQVFTVNKLILNTDANGIPVSWTLQTFATNGLGHTGRSVISNSVVVVKNHVYLTIDQQAYGVSGHYMNFTGGINSYKPYYDGTYTTPDPANFYLPDFTSKETNNTKYYLKT